MSVQASEVLIFHAGVVQSVVSETTRHPAAPHENFDTLDAVFRGTILNSGDEDVEVTFHARPRVDPYPSDGDSFVQRGEPVVVPARSQNHFHFAIRGGDQEYQFRVRVTSSNTTKRETHGRIFITDKSSGLIR